MDKKRRWAARILGGFFLVMAVCTVISRAASSLLVAQVHVEKPGRGRLSYSYEGSGELVPAEEQVTFLWPNQQIEWAAEQGSLVKAGECLIQFRLEYLQQEMERKQAEVEQMKLSLAQQRTSAKETEWVPVTVGASYTLEEARAQFAAAQQKLSAAQAAYEQFHQGFGAGNSGSLIAGENSVSSYGDSSISSEGTVSVSSGEPGSTLSGSSTEENMAARQAQQQELLAAVQEAQAGLEAARQTVTQAEHAYDLAAREDAARNANEANAAQAAELGVQSQEVQVEQAEKELERLQTYQNNGGKICAEQECVVLRMDVQAGAYTTGTEVLVTGYGGWKLKGEVAAEDKEKLKVGAEAEVRLENGMKKAVKIQSLDTWQGQNGAAGENNIAGTTNPGQEMSGVWYAPLPENVEGRAQASFTWSIENLSEKEYEQMIPLGALREDMDGAYCLILEEEETMLGTVQTARRISVRVLEKDTEKAAIQSTLKDMDQVIVSSEKYVEEGDRVRIKG